MRYTPEHKDKTRQRLLDAGGAIAKKDGFGTTGVDSLMASVGLTSGAFYAHFRSKGALLEAIVDNELGRSIEVFGQQSHERMLQTLDNYLSLAHVEHPELGCALPCLSPEIARAGEHTRQVFEQRLLQLLEAMRPHTGDDSKTWSIVSQVVGAVMLARAMDNKDCRQALLQAVKQQIMLLLPATGPAAPVRSDSSRASPPAHKA